MGLREILLLVGVAVAATRAGAQPVPELPQPRPLPPEQSLPELPQPRPVPHPPLPPLARQALASNRYKPVCEPETPTYWLWATAPNPHQPSWQECWMSCRDCLAWICTRPTCCQGMQPPCNASLYDWLRCHAFTFHSGTTAAPPVRVIPGTLSSAH